MKLLLFKYRGLIILTAIYLLTFALMLPLRSGAFEDDFAYILGARDFIITGKLLTPEWAAPAMLVQIVWGGLFAKIFGYSIAILHLSNVVLFYFGLIAFYLTLKRLKLGEFRAVLFSLLLLSYPWVFDFTYSYMTDIFYLSLFLISAYFYIKAFQTNSPYAFLLGSLFAGLSYLQRQIGSIIPVAVLLTFIFQFIVTKKIAWRNLLFALLPIAIVFVSYSYWLKTVGLTIAQQHYMIEPLQQQFLPKLIPHNLKYAVAQTQQYYLLALIKRGLAYFDNAITFLLPIFFIFNFSPRKIFSFIKDNFKPIFLTAAVVTFAYFIDFIGGKSYTGQTTSLILRYDIFITPHWNIVWPKMVWISRIIWIVMIALAIKKGYQALFTKRKGVYLKLFKIFFTSYLIFYLGIFLIFLQSVFPFVLNQKRIALALKSFRTSSDFFANLGNLLSIKHIFMSLSSAWFFLAVTLTTLTVFTYVLLTQKFKPLTKISQPLLFLTLILIGDLLVICFFNNYYYEEYVIQFIPIFFVWMAYLLKDVPISHIRAVIVVLAILIFSVSSTRQRYQVEGVSWQLGIQIVERGIQPDFIHVNWPWRPYWYFERVFPKLMEEYKDDKYKMPANKFAGWTRTANDPGVHYSSSQVLFRPVKRLDKILQSERFWLFTKQFPWIKWSQVTIDSSIVK